MMFCQELEVLPSIQIATIKWDLIRLMERFILKKEGLFMVL